jgi:hypothetical protein
MNAYLMLEVARQRTAERHEAAWKAGRRRAARKVARAQRKHAAAVAGTFEFPPVPDYVDGTFRGAEDEATAERAGASR